jgi:GDP-4-dehydro-6-deoxy-D-mannose reductase
MRVLVTGIDSFIGSWLGEALERRGDEVVGVTRRSDTAGGARRVADIRDGKEIARIVRETKPERIFHLAAQTNPKRSLAEPVETIEINVAGTIHVLEAARLHAPDARVLSVGSSAEYGETGRGAGKLSESMPLVPTAPYGVSKAAQGQLARVYAKAHKLHVVHVRPFAIVGPRKRGDAMSDFCSNVAQIELGRAAHLSVGNTSGVRDFVDVRDAADALMLLAEKGAAGETYNLCHGEETTLKALVDLVCTASRVPVKVAQDPSRLRVADDLRLIGDPSKLFSLGYAPRRTLAETVADTVEYWRGVHARAP